MCKMLPCVTQVWNGSCEAEVRGQCKL